MPKSPWSFITGMPGLIPTEFPPINVIVFCDVEKDFDTILAGKRGYFTVSFNFKRPLSSSFSIPNWRRLFICSISSAFFSLRRVLSDLISVTLITSVTNDEIDAKVPKARALTFLIPDFWLEDSNIKPRIRRNTSMKYSLKLSQIFEKNLNINIFCYGLRLFDSD